ncbi:16883_t:CDS:2 [Entrophospora sp. SA101]|nr:1267_t:CDS:2 [Entrophospora sp. SA101]CAJ0764752.1 16883_t:CDS:2 [Entrophospora sp. SA101]
MAFQITKSMQIKSSKCSIISIKKISRSLLINNQRRNSTANTNNTNAQNPSSSNDVINKGKILEKKTTSGIESTINAIPLLPIALIIAATALTGLGFYQYFTSNVHKYPPEIRNNLKKGLYYQNYQNDPNKAVNYYQTALNQAYNDESLDNSSPEVTGIMILLAGLYEEIGRMRDAVDVYTMAYDSIATTTMMDTDSNNNNNIGGNEKLKDDDRIRLIALAQKLGDLHETLKQDDKAEHYYVWSVEQLLQAANQFDHNLNNGGGSNGEGVGSGSIGMNNSNVNGSNNTATSSNVGSGGLFKKKLDVDPLPSWMTSTDLGASLEALASFYSSRRNYSYALPLYLRSLSLIHPPESSCHSAVLMNNISKVFTGMGELKEAQGWAERGLKLTENFQQNKKGTRECDETCDLSGDITKATEYYEKALSFAKKINFTEGIKEADFALQRITALSTL